MWWKTFSRIHLSTSRNVWILSKRNLPGSFSVSKEMVTTSKAKTFLIKKAGPEPRKKWNAKYCKHTIYMFRKKTFHDIHLQNNTRVIKKTLLSFELKPGKSKINTFCCMLLCELELCERVILFFATYLLLLSLIDNQVFPLGNILRCL